MALSLMKIFTALVVMGIVFTALGTLLVDYGTPTNYNQANLTCTGGCFYNVSANSSRTFYNSTYNPILKRAGAGLNLSNNLTSSSQAIGFSFAFVLNGFGSIITSMVQAPRTIGYFIATTMGNLGILIGGSSSLTAAVTNAVVGLLILYIVLLGVSSWMKYPLI